MALQVSSTANDQFVEFNMTVNQLTLTSQAGVTTTVYSTPVAVDFLPVNGGAAPFATFVVPRDTYTSAAIEVSNPAFTYAGEESSGEIYFSTDAYGYTPTPPTITLPSPLTVDGSIMGMTLNLQTVPSGSYVGAYPNQVSFNINPTFTLSSFAIPAAETGTQIGDCLGILGQVAALGAGSMTINLPINVANGKTQLTVETPSTTVYQGIDSASELAVGNLVSLDLFVQPMDGSYAATRVEVLDASAVDQVMGQLVQVDPSYSMVSTTAIQAAGTDFASIPLGMGYEYFYDSATKFQVAHQYASLSGLPFQPVFSAATLAAGQNVAIGSTSISYWSNVYTNPTSITLIPQTIDALVESVAQSGNYTVYSVELAPNDPIVQLNSPASAAVDSVVPHPAAITVFVDSGAALLNLKPLAAGENFRFTGVLFNDNGALRMVSQQVNDGVQF